MSMKAFTIENSHLLDISINLKNRNQLIDLKKGILSRIKNDCVSESTLGIIINIFLDFS